ncbi:leucine-rich repeat domain-containing protein [Ruminococcus sp.]|uniref:leucine-rich repeat domain-containing protein n=1 Tax=Ruminococcus sp. TaxID=41978 RepID=UPI0025EE075B|nr:leucine-rich repeat domain-containing protein [Ruminococcus sp.]MBQ8965770.1 leucine-rich repeat domain-containing protein [Ruminococcus sp.]
MTSEYFTILDGELITYSGNEKEVSVPDGVRVIQQGAFLGCSGIETITLPEGLEVISRKAFWGCEKLRQVIFPKSLRNIDLCAFRECSSLEEVFIPEGLVSMGDSVFRSCESLVRAVLPDSLKALGASTFSGCYRLREVVLPKNLYSISTNAFHSCIGLQSITIPENVKVLDTSAFLGCSALQEVRLPWGLRTIERQCFEGCRRLMKLDVPDSVEAIGANAFYKSGLMNFCKSDHLVLGRILVKYMGSSETTTVPHGVRVIGDHAFAYNETVREITLPDTVTEVQDFAFERCVSLTRVTMPEGLKRLGKGAFTDCSSLVEVDFPPHLDHIGANIFYGTAFEASHTEEMLVLSGKYLISYKGSSDSLQLPDGLEVIGDEAFVRCGSVREVIIPYGVRTIGKGAFRWRSELKKVIIPSTVTYIGENAFVNCHEPEITIMNPGGFLGENGIPDGTRLLIVVSSRVLKIRLTWEVKAGDCPERRLWNFVCVRSAATFAVLQKPEYKLSCAICFYDDGQWYRDYIRKNIVDAVCFAAVSDDSSLLERVLSFGLISKDQLQTCIEFAIEHKLTQQQVVLMKYRHTMFENT